jgi:hypothetical protein
MINMGTNDTTIRIIIPNTRAGLGKEEPPETKPIAPDASAELLQASNQRPKHD